MTDKNSVRTILLALLVVSAALTGPFAGSAAAASSDDTTVECSEKPSYTDKVIMFLSGTLPDNCQEVDPDEHKGADQNKDQTDLYAQDLGVQDQADSVITARDNYMQDTRSTAMSKARLAAAEAIEDGKSKSQVKQAAEQAVEDYYAQQQINLVKAQERHTSSLFYTSRSAWASDISSLHLVGTDAEGLDQPLIYGASDENGMLYNMTMHGQNGLEGHRSGGQHDDGLTDSIPNGTRTITLADDSTMKTSVFAVSNQYDADTQEMGGWKTGSFHTNALVFAPPNVNVTDDVDDSDKYSLSYSTENNHAMVIKAQDTDGTLTEVYDGKDYREQWIALHKQSDQMESNAETTAGKLYDMWDSNEIDTEGVAGPVAIAADAATDYNSTGHHAFASTVLASAGYSGSLNTTMTVDVYSGGEKTGDTSVSFQSSDGNVTIDSMSHGDVAEVYADDGSNSTVVSFAASDAGTSSIDQVEVQLINDSGSVITSVTTSDSDGDGVYEADLSGMDLSNTDEATWSVGFVAYASDGTSDALAGPGSLVWSQAKPVTTTTYNGQVLVSGTMPHGDNLDTGVTYDASTWDNATVRMVDANGDADARLIQINGRFEVTDMQTRDGTTVNQTTVEQKTYETLDEGELKTQLDRLSSLLEEYQTTSASTGGTSSGDGLPISNKKLAVIALAAALLLLGGKER